MSTRNTKKTSASETDDELRPEYDFDLTRVKPNRFAKRFKGKVIAVALDADVADVFQSSEAVNEFLRSAIKAMPSPRRAPRAGATRKARAS